MRAPALATSALILVLTACRPTTDNTPRTTDPIARPPAPTSTTTPGDGPDPHPHGIATAPQDKAAALVAAAFAVAAYTAGSDLVTRVAPYATERLLAAYSAPAATADETPDEQPLNAFVESVHPVTPTETRWRYEIVLTATETTPSGPRTRTAVLTVAIADTPAGPRVDTAR
ncbi:MAG: hypothetical protein ACRDY6_08275 [Acidimicrobiia bacterium]